MIASQILNFYADNNFRPVFWSGSGDAKGPREEGWTQKKYTKSDYRDGMRVGLMCGVEIAPGKFLGDVDIDFAPCMKVALYMLPPTDCRYGRASKEVSHCLYTTPEPIQTVRYEDPTDKMCLIEIRGTKSDGTIGMQSMAPPSVWSKDGKREELKFVRMLPPTHLNVAALLKPVTHTAIGMLLARHFGKNGFNHEMRLLFAGFLLRAGLTRDECVKLGEAILLVTGNTDKQDVAQSIDSTAKRLATEAKKVKGGPSLAKALGDHGKAIVDAINKWLGRESDFLRDKNGAIIRDHQENMVRALTLLNIELSHDEFSERVLINRTSPLEDRQIIDIYMRIDSEFHFRPTKEFLLDYLKFAAYQNSFHPVKDYLNSLKWDGTPRIDTWLIDAAGANDHEYVRAVSGLCLMAAAKRVFYPGSKFDEMVILESAQGLQKSTALRSLCPNENWFSDNFSLNMEPKLVIEATLGKWIIEVSEMSGMNKATLEHLKASMSRQADGPARMAYARMAIERLRHFILFGTTNSNIYLSDITGGRRFWPVPVKKFDVQWIEQHRDQLWAEAIYRVQKGESIRLPEHLWKFASREQEKRRDIDNWENVIRHYLISSVALHDYPDGRTRVTTMHLFEALKITVDRQDRRQQTRVSDTMRLLGFENKTMRLPGGSAERGYISVDKHWLQTAYADITHDGEEVDALNLDEEPPQPKDM